MYVQHVFERDGEVVAVMILKGFIRSGYKNLPTAEFLEALNLPTDSQELPVMFKEWQLSETRMVEELTRKMT